MKRTARSVALRVLLDSESGRRVSLATRFESSDFGSLQDRDRRLATELVYGVLRNRSLLDHQLDALLERPRAGLDPEVLQILRAGLFQLNYLKIPERAAVHESVRLCREFRKASAAPLVNAVLRRFLRNRPPLPDPGGTRSLSVRYSHPEWLVRRYLSRYGPEGTRTILERNNRPPPLHLWVNPFGTTRERLCRRLDREGVPFRLHPRLPHCVRVKSRSFVRHPLYRRGHCFLMSPASQEVAQLGDLRRCRVLGDFCAAPGGKSFILQARKRPGARLISCDLSLPRLRQMRARAGLYRIPQFRAVQADLVHPPFRRIFDFILLDVPCTGTATLRANPDIRWRLAEEDVQRMSRIQRALLRSSFRMLRPGGQLVYATCATEPEENLGVVEHLLNREPEAKLLRRPGGDFLKREAFFAACLVRKRGGTLRPPAAAGSGGKKTPAP